MKTGLAGDDDRIIAQPGLTEQISAAVGAVKAFVGLGTQARQSEPWLSGYNALYDGVKGNPHAPGTSAYKEWELGRAASEQDFEW